MAMEIVDGYAGQPHIDSDDLAALNIGCFGEGSYVFTDYGDALKATMTTSNQVTIGTGAILHEHRRAVNLSPQALTVQSGTQGQSRNDVVVARYDKASGTNVETMTLAVVKGTAVSYGSASDPTLGEGDMALWRIPIDGITPGDPVQLFEGLPSFSTFRDSVSPVMVTGSTSYTLVANGGTTVTVPLNVPEGYRKISVIQVRTGASSGLLSYFVTTAEGLEMYVYNTSSASGSRTARATVMCVRS